MRRGPHGLHRDRKERGHVIERADAGHECPPGDQQDEPEHRRGKRPIDHRGFYARERREYEQQERRGIVGLTSLTSNGLPNHRATTGAIR
jgi:hypothetical protein